MSLPHESEHRAFEISAPKYDAAPEKFFQAASSTCFVLLYIALSGLMMQWSILPLKSLPYERDRPSTVSLDRSEVPTEVGILTVSVAFPRASHRLKCHPLSSQQEHLFVITISVKR